MTNKYDLENTKIDFELEDEGTSVHLYSDNLYMTNIIDKDLDELHNNIFADQEVMNIYGTGHTLPESYSKGKIEEWALNLTEKDFSAIGLKVEEALINGIIGYFSTSRDKKHPGNSLMSGAMVARYQDNKNIRNEAIDVYTNVYIKYLNDHPELIQNNPIKTLTTSSNNEDVQNSLTNAGFNHVGRKWIDLFKSDREIYQKSYVEKLASQREEQTSTKTR